MRVRSASALLVLSLAIICVLAPTVALGATLTPAGTISNGLVTMSVKPISAGTVSFYLDGVVVATKRAGFTITNVYEDGTYDGYYSASHQVFLTDGIHTLAARQGGAVVGSSSVTVKAPPQLEAVGTDGVNGTVTFANNGPTMTCNFYDPTIATLVKSGGPSAVTRDQFGMYHLTFTVPQPKCTFTGNGYACDIYSFGFKANEAFPTGGVSVTTIGTRSYEKPTCTHWWDTSAEGVWEHENGIGCELP